MSEAEFKEAAEVAHELIRERAGEDESPHWIAWTAISTMVMALFSAVGALLAGITANEALLERTEEIIDIVNRDRDQIEREVLQTRVAVLAAMGENAGEEQQRIEELISGSDTLTQEVTSEESEVRESMRAHELFAIGVTILSIAITLSGMAVVSKRPRIWHVGLLVGCGGLLIVSRGFVEMFN